MGDDGARVRGLPHRALPGDRPRDHGRSRSIVGSIGASLQTLVGGNITLFTELCEHAREEAFEIMLKARL
jgi:hypothetical protein